VVQKFPWIFPAAAFASNFQPRPSLQGRPCVLLLLKEPQLSEGVVQQGDRIGRISAVWAIVFLALRFFQFPSCRMPNFQLSLYRILKVGMFELPNGQIFELSNSRTFKLPTVKFFSIKIFKIRIGLLFLVTVIPLGPYLFRLGAHF
jgi:hypothetical protein